MGDHRVAPGKDRRQNESQVDRWGLVHHAKGRGDPTRVSGRVGHGQRVVSRVTMAAESRVDLKGASPEAEDHYGH